MIEGGGEYKYLVPPLSKVDLANPVGVDGVPLVGVNHDHEEARVGVDHLALVAGLQVPEDRSVIEIGQVDHVLALLELGRVDATYISSLEGELLVAAGHPFPVPPPGASSPGPGPLRSFGQRDSRRSK